MDSFVKLFFAEDIGQVVVLQTVREEGPTLELVFRPEHLHVCRIVYAFSDDEAGWEELAQQFNEFNEQETLDTVRGFLLSPSFNVHYSHTIH